MRGSENNNSKTLEVIHHELTCIYRLHQFFISFCVCVCCFFFLIIFIFLKIGREE